MTNLRVLSACLVACATLSLVGCGPSRNEQYKTVEASEADARIKELENLLAASEAKQASATITKGGGVNSGTDVDGAALGSGATVGTRAHGDEIVITIDNAILFRPGKNELSAQAKATLSRVATLLNQKYANDDVRVEGFTDNEAITRSKDQWDDNWDLAGGRARAVLHYLIERGVSAKRLGFAGYADNKPVSANSSEAGRAKNRRVEIVVLPNTGGARRSEAAPAEKHEHAAAAKDHAAAKKPAAKKPAKAEKPAAAADGADNAAQ